MLGTLSLHNKFIKDLNFVIGMFSLQSQNMHLKAITRACSCLVSAAWVQVFILSFSFGEAESSWWSDPWTWRVNVEVRKLSVPIAIAFFLLFLWQTSQNISFLELSYLSQGYVWSHLSCQHRGWTGSFAFSELEHDRIGLVSASDPSVLWLDSGLTQSSCVRLAAVDCGLTAANDSLECPTSSFHTSFFSFFGGRGAFSKRHKEKKSSLHGHNKRADESNFRFGRIAEHFLLAERSASGPS